MIKPQQLKEIFDYDPETGILRWKVTTGRRRKAGDVAGCNSPDGRVLVGLFGRLYKAHRIIWAMQTGKWPKGRMDHRNENGLDNRWDNLRRATHSENMCNVRHRRSNTSGIKGVSLHKATGKWRADIKLNKKPKFLGYFEHKEDARKAYAKACDELHGEFANHD